MGPADPQAAPHSRSGRVAGAHLSDQPSMPPAPPPTEVVEMMLMQNAQMHQVLMQALMLRALPPAALAPTPPHLTPQVGSTPRPRPEDLVASPPETHVFLAPGLCFLPEAPGAPQGNPTGGGQVVPSRHMSSVGAWSAPAHTSDPDRILSQGPCGGRGPGRSGRSR